MEVVVGDEREEFDGGKKKVAALEAIGENVVNIMALDMTDAEKMATISHLSA